MRPDIDNAGSPVVDATVLAGLRELGDGFLDGLVDEYLTSMQAYLEGLATAVAAADTATVCRLAHTMKSSSASLGAMELAGRCQAVESVTRRGAMDGVEDLAEEIRARFADVRLVLEARRGGGPPRRTLRRGP